MLNFIFFVSDQGLQKYQFLLKLLIINILTTSKRFIIQSFFVETLTVIELVVIDFWVETDELLVDLTGVGEILILVVAIG